MHKNNLPLNFSKLILALFTFVAIAIVGFLILSIAGSRVGEHNSSTYGTAYNNFAESWGGEINMEAPQFLLVYKDSQQVYTDRFGNFVPQDSLLRLPKNVVIQRVYRYYNDSLPLYPETIGLNMNVVYNRHEEEWLTFNTYAVHAKDHYTITNPYDMEGELTMNVIRPEGSQIFYDYKVVGESKDSIKNFALDKNFTLKQSMQKGETYKLTLHYSTKGIDQFNYKLSSYQSHIIKLFSANLNINTTDFELDNFGLPHTIKSTKHGKLVQYSFSNFSTSQDIGIAFNEKVQHLDKITKLIRYSPVALILFLLILFILAQTNRLTVYLIHYFFAAIILLFYYLFLSYLIRFFGIWASIAISVALIGMLSLLYFPLAFGKAFYIKTVLPYFILLTLVFSLIFMVPVLQGILFLLLIFGVFIHFLIVLGKSDFTKWPVLEQNNSLPS